MINNFDNFKWEWVEGEFYFLQIIKRKKDNPDVAGINGNNHMRCIKDYSMYNKEQLEKYKQEIIDIATVTNSRIYMHPTRRNKEEIRKEMCYMIGENIMYNRHNLSGLYRSACGQNKGVNKLWIVDVDDDKGVPVEMVKATIEGIRPCKEISQILKTKSGYHIIAYPFDLKQFKEMHPNIDVHKNNPTLMYCN